MDGSLNAEEEVQSAKAYWASIGVLPFYLQEGLQSTVVVAAVKELSSRTPIRSAFEFGCNAGRNLHSLRSGLSPGLRLKGIDINADAVAAGRDRFGIDLEVSDEASLSAIPDQSFDICFTVSVLDHIGSRDLVRSILQDLSRVSSKYVLLLEPYNGCDEKSPIEKSSAFNYYWNYSKIAQEIGLTVHQLFSCPLDTSDFRRDYRLFLLKRSRELPSLAPLFFQRLRLRRWLWRLSLMQRMVRG